MDSDDEFEDLGHRLRAGDQSAAVVVFERFARRLAGLARARLDARVRSKFDADDVTQSAFRSFFRRTASGDLELESWDAIWALLAVITLRKCGHRDVFFRAGRRNIGLEVSPVADPDGSFTSWEAIAREVSPDDAVVLQETVDELLIELSSRDRRILESYLQGSNKTVISKDVGCTERTVERVLKSIRERLSQ